MNITIHHWKKDENKELAFLDVKIKNNGKGQYDFNIFRKNVIINWNQNCVMIQESKRAFLEVLFITQ